MEHNKDTTVAETSTTQWHPAFFGSLQIEFEKEADKLLFESEHQLSTKPMAIDVLIIKKISNEPIKKNIGRIFRKHNLIEYKSPDDYLSIDDFYKVYGYACFYKYDTSITNEIKITDLTISFVCEGYPRKLIRHLETTKKYKISKHGNGIYYVEGDMNIYNKNRTNPLYRSVMNTIVNTNKRIFKEEQDMCQALEEIFMEKYEEIFKEKYETFFKEKYEAFFMEKLTNEIVKEKARVNALTLKLLELDRTDDIKEAAQNPDFQNKLFEEFGL